MKAEIRLVGAIVDRRDFVAWVGNQMKPKITDVPSLNLQRNLKDESCALIWMEGQVDTSRPIIVVAERNLSDFFAFVNTYVAGFNPFSAYFRVVGQKNFDDIINGFNSNDGKSLPNASIGIAVAEAILRQNGRRPVESLSVTAVRAMLSSALLSALYQGGAYTPLDDIAYRWTNLRQSFGEDDSVVIDHKVAEVISLFFPVFFTEKKLGKSGLSAAISQAARDGAVTLEAWQLLTREYPDLKGLFEKLRGPREERLKNAQNALKDLFKNRLLDPTESECLTGCVLALIGDGSFQYLPFAMSFGDSSPGNVIWFAAWCSLFKSNDILSYGAGIGRRVARDIFTPSTFFNVPSCDISFEEWTVVSGPSGQINFHSLTTSLIAIEISAGNNSIFRLKRAALDQERSSIGVEELEEVARLVERTRMTLNRITHREKDFYQGRLPYGDRPKRQR